MNNNGKISFLLISGVIVSIFSVINYPLNGYFFKFLDLLNASAIAGILTIINHRLKFFWFIWTISLMLVVTYYKTVLLPKFFSSWLSVDILAYTAGLLCFFYAFLLFFESDYILIKIVSVATVVKIVPNIWIFGLFYLCNIFIPHANDFFVSFAVIGSAVILTLVLLKIGFFWIISD